MFTTLTCRYNDRHRMHSLMNTPPSNKRPTHMASETTDSWSSPGGGPWRQAFTATPATTHSTTTTNYIQQNAAQQYISHIQQYAATTGDHYDSGTDRDTVSSLGDAIYEVSDVSNGLDETVSSPRPMVHIGRTRASKAISLPRRRTMRFHQRYHQHVLHELMIKNTDFQ